MSTVNDASDTLTVSVIATVYNEAESIGRLLDTLAAQTRAPDEVVIVDGGSTDGTLEILRRWARGSALPLVVISAPGTNISSGRNQAIEAARGPIIGSTDAGVRLERGWLAALVAPFDAPDGDTVDLVAGFFASDPQGAFETALGATTLPLPSDVDPDTFLPSSRSVAFRKTAWRAAGGYPEWLDYCEDLVLDFRLRAGAGRQAFAPQAVAHFRPRGTLGAFFRQYYHYARGDGKSNLWAGRHAIRYATYLGALPLLAGLAARHTPLWALGLATGLALMVRTPYRRLIRQWAPLSWRERLAAALWVPIVRVTGDVAKMLGYPVGLAWRWRRQPPSWRPSPEVGRL